MGNSTFGLALPAAMACKLLYSFDLRWNFRNIRCMAGFWKRYSEAAENNRLQVVAGVYRGSCEMRWMEPRMPEDTGFTLFRSCI